jgi:hypothetical protein
MYGVVILHWYCGYTGIPFEEKHRCDLSKPKDRKCSSTSMYPLGAQLSFYFSLSFVACKIKGLTVYHVQRESS